MTEEHRMIYILALSKYYNHRSLYERLEYADKMKPHPEMGDLMVYTFVKKYINK